MVLFQPARYCRHCGEQLEEIHTNFKTILVGDTFLGYKPHKCKDPLEQIVNKFGN